MNALMSIAALDVVALLQNLSRSQVTADDVTEPHLKKDGVNMSKPYRKLTLTLPDGSRAWVNIELEPKATAPAVAARPSPTERVAPKVRRSPQPAQTVASKPLPPPVREAPAKTAAHSDDLAATLKAMLENQRLITERLAKLETSKGGDAK